MIMRTQQMTQKQAPMTRTSAPGIAEQLIHEVRLVVASTPPYAQVLPYPASTLGESQRMSDTSQPWEQQSIPRPDCWKEYLVVTPRGQTLHSCPDQTLHMHTCTSGRTVITTTVNECVSGVFLHTWVLSRAVRSQLCMLLAQVVPLWTPRNARRERGMLHTYPY